MSERLQRLNFNLLVTLGLSKDSAVIGVKWAGEAIERAEEKLAEARTRLATEQANLVKLEDS